MAGRIPGAQCHFLDGCRMGIAMFRLAAALGLSEAPKLEADSLCPQTRAS